MTKAQDERRIKDVLHERAGYQRSGKKERIAACEAELKRLGYEEPDTPKGRSSSEANKAKADQPEKQGG